MLQKKSTSKAKITPLDFFVIAVFLSALIYFLTYIIIGNGRFSDTFFKRGGDFFMDFFNSVRDASQGSAVYTERGVIYPPMANLVFLIFSRFTPTAYNNTGFYERQSWTDFVSPLILVMLCTAMCAVLFFFIVHSATKSSSAARKFAFTLAALFSVPTLFMLERGNILVLCLLCLLVYSFTYNSKSKLHREIGLICLAFAFSLKLYPAVFGWFLIADKRKKDAVRCVIYGALMLIIPSFFFGGPICFYHMFLNIFNFSAGSGSALSKILTFIHMPSVGITVFTIVAYLWVVACGACFAFSPFLFPQKAWRTWTLGLATLMCIPSLTSVYNWGFFIIPLILIFNQRDSYTRHDWIYVVMLTLPFIFIPGRIALHVSPSIVLTYVMSAVISIFTVIDFLSDARKHSKAKKQAR